MTTYTPQQKSWFAAVAARAPKPLALPAASEQQFGAQRNAANYGYKTGIANNAYQRAGSAADFVRQFRDLNTNYDKQRQEMPYAANERGILGSGIFHQQLQDYGQARIRATGDLGAAQTQQLGSYDIARQQIEAQRAQALAAIEAQRQAMMNSMAPGTVK